MNINKEMEQRIVKIIDFAGMCVTDDDIAYTRDTVTELMDNIVSYRMKFDDEHDGYKYIQLDDALHISGKKLSGMVIVDLGDYRAVAI